MAFQNKTIFYNLKAISLHGLALWFAFLLGASTAMAPWLLPFVTASLSFLAFLITKFYQIPKPDYFFVLMLFATAYNFKNPSWHLIKANGSPLLIGVLVSVIVSILISYLLGLPWNSEKLSTQSLALKNRYQAMLKDDPSILIKASHFSSVLFVTGYLAFLLKDHGGYWILISSAAVLSGEHLERIKSRTLSRVLGTIVGLMIGLAITKLQLSLLFLILILILSNFLTEYFMPKNYIFANFFTNPQVIILMTLSHTFGHGILSMRFIGVFVGSLLSLFIILILEYALQSMINHKDTLNNS
ncbi:FUSC family protein [Streptococcus didelphis]|uniref:FUSC family protein n=1 Tax=Streptococcus didelphis TaxID=102886 RepID=A0ABY9LGF5_9STRE|nr:FUSC family protein [Streptococcus didelphis]WMB27919.1 FUSC family protein [Streptococcus didelphis]